jgi:hypothetical protein
VDSKWEERYLKVQDDLGLGTTLHISQADVLPVGEKVTPLEMDLPQAKHLNPNEHSCWNNTRIIGYSLTDTIYVIINIVTLACNTFFNVCVH